MNEIWMKMNENAATIDKLQLLRPPVTDQKHISRTAAGSRWALAFLRGAE
jgi:hypothetical protein